MERLCHVFQVAPGREEEYVRRHVEIWQASMEGLVVGLTDEHGELVRYAEDWHLE